MSSRPYLALAVLAIAAALWQPSASGQVLKDEAALVGSATSTPRSRGFQVTQAGRYELRLVDLDLPAPSSSLQAMVTRGDEKIVAIGAEGQVSFDASAGNYQVQVAGLSSAAAPGSFSVRVASLADNSIVIDYSDTVIQPQAALPPGQAVWQTQVQVAIAGNYRITLDDLDFPAALTGADLLLVRDGQQAARVSLASPVADFAAVPGSYDLLAVAQAAGTVAAGLVGIRIVNLGDATAVYDVSQPIGSLGSPQQVTLPSSSAYSLAVADLLFPSALASAQTAIVSGSKLLAQATAANSSTFSAVAGSVSLYSLPVAASADGVGSMSVDLLRGIERVKFAVYPATPPPATSTGITLSVADVVIAASGGYRATLTDFDFPAALTEIQLAVFQGGGELGRRTGSGSLELQAAAEPLIMLVAARPGPAGSGLYGLQLSSVPGGALAFETTNATGANLERRVIDVAVAGSYDVRITDLQFPIAFGELSAALTRGTQRIGFVFSGGSFSFNASPGSYFLNLVTRVDPVVRFATYGLKIAATPPAPTVNLSSDSAAVASGGSTTLTWSSTGATACVASGQWTGGRALSGTQTVGPISVDSTFTLTCNGPGGSTTKAVTVNLRSPNSGGGGASDLPVALGLLLLALRCRRRTRY